MRPHASALPTLHATPPRADPAFFSVLTPTLPAQSSVEPRIIEVPQLLSPTPSSLPPQKIATWNIQWFPGRQPLRGTAEDAREQTRAVRALFNQVKPDILFACEVRSLEALQELKLKGFSLACTQIPRTEEENPELPNQGLALLSRVPWLSLWALDFSTLSPGPDRPPRGILGARFALPAGRSLTLYGVHLKSNRGDANANRLKRERAMEYLRWDWKRLGLDPQKDRILLVGDFNTSLHLPAFEEEQTLRALLREGFVDAASALSGNERITLPSAPGSPFPPADFDQILLSPALAADYASTPPQAHITPAPAQASDHHLMSLLLPEP
ncbi:MAG: hypothetical protein HC904_10095 [Blastochloris sp.]|nr:hypothetical protein [Blastochloris sp.]